MNMADGNQKGMFTDRLSSERYIMFDENRSNGREKRKEPHATEKEKLDEIKTQSI